MAIRAAFEQYNDGIAFLDLCLDQRRMRTSEDPDVPWHEWTTTVLFYVDYEKLDVGEWEFLGLTILYIDRLGDEDLRAIEYLQLPLVDIPERGLFGVEIADVLRQARDRTLVSTAG